MKRTIGTLVANGLAGARAGTKTCARRLGSSYLKIRYQNTGQDCLVRRTAVVQRSVQ